MDSIKDIIQMLENDFLNLKSVLENDMVIDDKIIENDEILDVLKDLNEIKSDLSYF